MSLVKMICFIEMDTSTIFSILNALCLIRADRETIIAKFKLWS